MNVDEFKNAQGEILWLDPRMVEIEISTYETATGQRIGYQRERDMNQIKKDMVDLFDPRLFDYPVISRRILENGWMPTKLGDYAIDGQGRILAARKLIEDGVINFVTIPMRVLTNQTPEDEVLVYCALQTQRKNLTPVQRFAAQASVTNSWQNKIDKVLREKFEIWIGSKSSCPEGNQPYQLTTALEKIHIAIERANRRTERNLDISDVTSDALSLIIKAFGKKAISTSSLEGAAEFLISHADKTVDDYAKKLKERIEWDKFSAEAMVDAGGSSGKKATSFEKAFRDYALG